MAEKKQTVIQLLLISLLVLALWQDAYAGGVRLVDQDPDATARGNAFTATADNASAAYYNPAALTELEGLQLRVGFYAVNREVEHESNLHSSNTINDPSGPPQAYATYRVPSSDIAVGLALYSPYGSGTEWPEDTGFRGIITKADLIYATLSPVIAWKVTPKFSIGAGPTVNYLSLEINHGISPIPAGPAFHLEGNGTSVGFTVGALYRPNINHSLGFRFVSSTYTNFDGETDATGLPSADNVSSEVPTPEFFTIGYSYRPDESWNFEFDVDWTNWNRDNTLIFHNSSLGEYPLVLEWSSSVALLFGATKKLENGYSVSAGYYFNQNAVPTKYFSPAVPDMNMHYLSIGTSKRYDNWGWSVAYQHGFSENRDVVGAPQSPVGESADGKYSTSTDAITFALNFS